MTKEFMALVAKALYVLILMGLREHPYLSHGKQIDSVLSELIEFCPAVLKVD